MRLLEDPSEDDPPMPVGISFSEKMAGPFALGESNPRDGLSRGRREGSELSMRVTIAIKDLDRFLHGHDHPGGLSGYVDFTPWSAGINAPRGVFKLFSPTSEPDLKLMIYELAFVFDGEPWFLAGRKEVRDDPGFDLWEDTTTLHTRLHRGTDARGETAGAGVLTLGVTDLVRLVGTIKASGGSAAQQARAVRRFGSFFLGELWGSYARHARIKRVDE